MKAKSLFCLKYTFQRARVLLLVFCSSESISIANPADTIISSDIKTADASCDGQAKDLKLLADAQANYRGWVESRQFAITAINNFKTACADYMANTKQTGVNFTSLKNSRKNVIDALSFYDTRTSKLNTQLDSTSTKLTQLGSQKCAVSLKQMASDFKRIEESDATQLGTGCSPQ